MQLLLPHPASIRPEAYRLLGIFLATVVGLILRPVPGSAVVLAGVVLAATVGGLGIQRALGGFSDPTVWLVIAAFIISDGLAKSGLARRIALMFVRAFGKSSLGVSYSLTLTDMVLAMVIPSNSARSGGVVLPIARSIAELYGSYPGVTSTLLGSFLLSSVYQGVCVTAAMFLTGQASNPLAARMSADLFQYPITFTKWMLVGIVPGVCSIALIPWLVHRLDPPRIRKTPEAAAFAATELEKMGPMDRPQVIASVVFAGVCTLWITGPINKLDITLTALIGAVVLVLTGVLKWEDVAGSRATWDVFIWFGGLVCLGKAIGEAGLTNEFARAVVGRFSGFGWAALLLVALLINFYAHYGFASITAHMTAMFPAFAAVLIAKGAPIGLVVFSFATFTNLCSCLTHYGTTPSPMFFAQDYVSLRKWWTAGFACSLVHIVVWCTVGFSWWKLIGVW